MENVDISQGGRHLLILVWHEWPLQSKENGVTDPVLLQCQNLKTKTKNYIISISAHSGILGHSSALL